MRKNHTPIATALLLFFIVLFVPSLSGAAPTHAADGKRQKCLRMGFYESTCPQAEEIVRQTVTDNFISDPDIPAGLIRLHFHDCFVRGCDASILLDETPSGDHVEKSSPANGNSLRGLEVIDMAKSQLESECPGTVSCADILALAARDAAVLAGLPTYRVPSGRRDGTVSKAIDIIENLPSPFSSIKELTHLFAKKGFSQKEMVILSGAHSIGGAHCSSFDYRLYNYTAKQSQDPDLNSFYAEYLKFRCPGPTWSFLAGLSGSKKVDFSDDVWSKRRLDARYYNELEEGKGLLASDQALMKDKSTRTVVRRMARHPMEWASKFGEVMVKLGKVDVLVGEHGEVRRSCRFVN